MNYLFEKLDNTIHDITEKQVKELWEDNRKEAAESRRMTEASYRGENYYEKIKDFNAAFLMEITYRDSKTSGMKVYYPHGVVIEQANRRNYFRGENQIYPSSIPKLLRKLNEYNSKKDKELYRLVSDMRIYEFKSLIYCFEHVKNWNYCDVLYEPLAQHYGIETCWLDITNDFNVALFFACCYWDEKEKRWLPLTQKQTEVDENHKYGMIFHMPSYQMPLRWTLNIPAFVTYTDKIIGQNEEGENIHESLVHPLYQKDIDNLVVPIGFQPFRRCSMQSGYGIYMRNPIPLQMDTQFQKYRFRHNEKLSKWIYGLMREGKSIYPHEGLAEADFIINQIANLTEFSKEAFQYALYRNHYYRIDDEAECLKDLSSFRVDGKNIIIQDGRPWHITPGRRRKIDHKYDNFSLEREYNIMVLQRTKIPSPDKMFEPWMIPDKDDGEGVKDFRVREKLECGSSIIERNLFSTLNTLLTKKSSDW